MGAELYDMLCSLTSGEASTIVRGEVGMNAFMAWRNLCKMFNLITPAKALTVMMEVINPPKVMDVYQIPKAIDDWDVRVGTMNLEFNEKLSDRIKPALMRVRQTCRTCCTSMRTA